MRFIIIIMLFIYFLGRTRAALLAPSALPTPLAASALAAPHQVPHPVRRSRGLLMLAGRTPGLVRRGRRPQGRPRLCLPAARADSPPRSLQPCRGREPRPPDDRPQRRRQRAAGRPLSALPAAGGHAASGGRGAGRDRRAL